MRKLRNFSLRINGIDRFQTFCAQRHARRRSEGFDVCVHLTAVQHSRLASERQRLGSKELLRKRVTDPLDYRAVAFRPKAQTDVLRTGPNPSTASEPQASSESEACHPVETQQSEASSSVASERSSENSGAPKGDVTAREGPHRARV